MDSVAARASPRQINHQIAPPFSDAFDRGRGAAIIGQKPDDLADLELAPDRVEIVGEVRIAGIIRAGRDHGATIGTRRRPIEDRGRADPGPRYEAQSARSCDFGQVEERTLNA